MAGGRGGAGRIADDACTHAWPSRHPLSMYASSRSSCGQNYMTAGADSALIPPCGLSAMGASRTQGLILRAPMQMVVFYARTGVGSGLVARIWNSTTPTNMLNSHHLVSRGQTSSRLPSCARVVLSRLMRVSDHRCECRGGGASVYRRVRRVRVRRSAPTTRRS